MSQALNTRATSGFALSIGTGIAMETIFAPVDKVYDPERKVPDKEDMSDYGQFWINLTTVFRNMVGSIDKSETPALISEQDYADHILIEMQVIRDLFNSVYPNVKVHFYFSDYAKLFKGIRYSKVQLRKDNSDAKKAYTKTMMKCMDILKKRDDSIHALSNQISPLEKSKTLICTHQCFDLLSYHKFGSKQDSMKLLESHTGVVKKRHEWSSKYYPIPAQDMAHIPFQAMLLFVFGDRNLIQPLPMQLRKTIVDISVSRNWTPFTSYDKVRFDISNDIKETFVKDFVLSLPQV